MHVLSPQLVKARYKEGKIPLPASATTATMAKNPNKGSLMHQDSHLKERERERERETTKEIKLGGGWNYGPKTERGGRGYGVASLNSHATASLIFR